MCTHCDPGCTRVLEESYTKMVAVLIIRTTTSVVVLMRTVMRTAITVMKTTIIVMRKKFLKSRSPKVAIIVEVAVLTKS